MFKTVEGGTKILTTPKSHGQLKPSDLKDLIVSSLDDDKAIDIEAIDLSGKSALADYIIVASGNSSTQIVRIAEKLRERLNVRGIKDIRIEGAGQGDWVVLDAGDIVVHLFRPEVREFYNIEKMWNMSSAKGAQESGFQIA